MSDPNERALPTESAAARNAAHWKASLVILGVGAVMYFTVPLLPDPDPSDRQGMAVLGVIDVLMLAAIWLIGPRPWLLRVSPPAVVLLLSATVAVTKPIGALPFFYLWPLLTTAYFLNRRDLGLVLAVLYVSYGAALYFFVAPGVRGIFFLSTVTSATFVPVLVKAQRESRDALVARLHQAAATDPLTGLLNRRSFHDRFERELARAGRLGTTLTVVIVDLDLFKSINDRFGHAGGDRALRRVAELLTEHARQADVIARIGGEEFAALLLDTDGEGARTYVERTGSALRADRESQEMGVSLSAGVAQLSAQLDSSDALLLAADAALYEAKKAGRRRVAVCGGKTSEIAPDRGTAPTPA